MRSPLVLFALLLSGWFAWFPQATVAAQPDSGSLAGIIEQCLPVRMQNLLGHHSGPLRDDGAVRLQQMRMSGEKAPAALQAIVLMCDFSDSLLFGRFGQVPGEFPDPMQSEIYYSAHDSVFFSHLFGDVADYFHDVSGGDFTFNYTIHPRVVNLPHPMSYYGNHPEKGEQTVLLASDVVDSLDGEIDFSLFDTFIVIHAGAGQETDILGNSPEQIFSNFLDPSDFQQAFEDGDLENPWLPSVDFGPDAGIDQVLILPECEYQDPIGGFGGYFGSLGVYCFEVGLRLGMLSLSDFTPSGFPDSQGIGEFGLMGYGLFVGMGWIPPHPCAFNKMLMGWLEPRVVDPLVAGQQILTPSEQTGSPDAALRVEITGQEYWLLAYRLQDPDGNRIYSFPGDLNGNNIPDFWDDDSPTDDGVPVFGVGKFDPATDIRERLGGGEWDFFMSENSARAPGVKGAGSGIYIWHIDEGVIQDVFGMASNRFNADPKHKSVDLEEADGIQDLDSREPSPFILGGDDDSFRGEDNYFFGPETLPDTRSATGARTNVRFQDISLVVLDSMSFVADINDTISPPDTLWGFEYADIMSFQLDTQGGVGAGPEIHARLELSPGISLAGSHVLLTDLGGAGDAAEVIVTGRQGEIFVFDGDLNEFLDHDLDPDTVEPFAVGTYANNPVLWNQPSASGDWDGDGIQSEIILTGPRGLYVFGSDGNPLVANPGNVGLVVETESCSLPPVLIPRDRVADYALDEAVDAAVIFQEMGESHLRLYRGLPATMGLHFNLGAVRVESPPVYAWQQVVVAVYDTLSNESQLVFCAVDESQVPGSPQTVSMDLPFRPGNFPVQLGYVDHEATDTSVRYAIVPGVDGQAVTLFFTEDLVQEALPMVWNDDIRMTSPVAPGGSFISNGVLGRVGHNGSWSDGWPRRPAEAIAIASDSLAGGPLVARLVGAQTPLRQFVFPVYDGRIFGFGMKGESLDGWPAAGPARSVGTPALGAVQGESTLDLVALGTFGRITGLNDSDGELETTDVSTLVIWSAVAQSDPLWPMWGGSPWRNGSWDMSAWTGPPVASDGSGLVPGSHICYPSPLGDEPLQVRARVRSASKVKVSIHNLEGEVVAFSEWQSVVAVDPFTVTLNLENTVSGMYLCRLVAESDLGQVDNSVVPFAIVR